MDTTDSRFEKLLQAARRLRTLPNEWAAKEKLFEAVSAFDEPIRGDESGEEIFKRIGRELGGQPMTPEDRLTLDDQARTASLARELLYALCRVGHTYTDESLIRRAWDLAEAFEAEAEARTNRAADFAEYDRLLAAAAHLPGARVEVPTQSPPAINDGDTVVVEGLPRLVRLETATQPDAFCRIARLERVESPLTPTPATV